MGTGRRQLEGGDFSTYPTGSSQDGSDTRAPAGRRESESAVRLRFRLRACVVELARALSLSLYLFLSRARSSASANKRAFLRALFRLSVIIFYFIFIHYIVIPESIRARRSLRDPPLDSSLAVLRGAFEI